MRFVELSVVLEHVLQEIRRVELVGAFAGAAAAADAVVDLLHLGLPLRRHVRLPRRAAQEHVHARALADLDAHRARHAVAAAAAERAGELFSLLLDESVELRVHVRVLLGHLQPLLEFLHLLDAPDGDDVVIAVHEGVAGAGVREQAAGKTLHGDIAHVRRFALFGQREIALGGDVAEGELQRFKQSRFNALLRHGDPVRCDADVVDPATRLRLERAGIGAVGVVRIRHLRHLMELEEVDVIRLHHLQAVFNVREHACARAVRALGREHNLIAHVAERKADLLLAVGIGVGSVKIADAAVEGCAEELHGVLLRAALHGQAAHGGLCDDKAGFSEC